MSASPAPLQRGRWAVGFSRQAALLLAALTLLNASNYAFHVVATRALEPSDYGALAALLAVLIVLSVPFTVVQTVVTGRAARADIAEDAAAFTVATIRQLMPVALAFSVAAAALAPALSRFLRIDVIDALQLAPFSFLALLTSVPLGALQGAQQFGRLALASGAGAVGRLGIGWALLAAGAGVSGAMASIVLAQLASLVLALALVGVRRNLRGIASSPPPLGREIRRTLLALSAFWVFVELDIVLARRFLDPSDAGMYSSAGILARGILFVGSAVAVAALPRFAATRARGAEATRWLGLSLALVALIGACGAAFLAAFGDGVLGIAFGDTYAPAADLLPLLALGGALLAALNVVVYFHAAGETRAYVILVAAAIAEAGLVAAFHETPRQIATSFVAVTAAALALQLHAALAIARYAPIERRATQRRLSGEGSLELSVVLPCHNSASALMEVIDGLHESLADVGDYEIIVVSDGSTDDTVSVARGCVDPRVRVVEYRDRVGKGHALRVGLSQARGRYVAFMDSDGDIAPSSLRPFVELMRLYDPDIVLASKRHPLSDVVYPTTRRIMSWGYHRLTRLLFRVDVRDTQAGLKLVRRDVLAAVLPRMVEKRYAFDLELLVVARALGFRRVFEAPLRLHFRFASGVNLRTTGRVFVDTLAIFYRRHVLDAYRPREWRRAAPRRLPNAHRILIVNWKDVRHPAAGGAEAYVHEIARRWAAHGHAVDLLAPRFPGARPVEMVDGVRIRRMGRLTRGTFHVRALRELRRAHDVDFVLESINTVPTFAATLGRLPAVALVHQLAREVWNLELPAPLAAVGKAVEPRLLAPYRRVPTVAVSASTRADLRGLGFEDVEIVPCGLDHPPPIKAPKESVPTFVYVGRLAANKRPDHAVAAFAEIRKQLPDARLWLIGSGALRDQLAATLPAGAELLGYLERGELYERVARAHCLLVPSVREGWGLVVVEAGSLGTPSVGYDVPGLRDSIRDGVTGALAAPGDPADMARRAVELVLDRDRYEATAREARTWADRLSWDATASDLLRRLEAVASRRPSASGLRARAVHPTVSATRR